MKTTQKWSKMLLAGMAAIMLAFGLVLVGCVSTPEPFETAGSLAGTAWETSPPPPANGHSMLVINDTTSGVFTSMEGAETPFTYTAVYDAEKRSFTGTLTPAGGAEGTFSITKAGGIWWRITAPSLRLNNEEAQYLSHEQIQRQAETKRLTAEREEQFGALYTLPGSKERATLHFKRDSDGMKIYFDFYGEFVKDLSRDVNLNSAAGVAAALLAPDSPHYEIRSKDGATMTLIKRGQAIGSYSQTSSGTFRLSVSGDMVTISGGTGDGAQFNGVWVADTPK